MIFSEGYYSVERLDVQEFTSDLDLRGKSILEIGAGRGKFIQYIKQFNPLYVDAIELVGGNKKSLEKLCRKVVIGNVENKKLNYNYDFIFILDTLEHLLDPKSFIENLSKDVRPKTKIIISLPNNSHWTVVFQLLRDHIRYNPNGGLLDYTHYHFFTHKSFEEMIRSTDFKIIKHKRKMLKDERFFNLLSLGILKHLFTFQNFYLLERK